MKFIHYLEQTAGVDILGLASLLIFFMFFVVMIVWVVRTDKKKIEEISKIPLDNTEQ
ncbi:MAG: CcoQ/FixQ family Cbb3-type cytochrome c oxidase assembly chaperone [Chitinophagaceae bacterium]|nr:CcoQ/FixQ family Cbb3-type cytochrome c oxidase assembly chaperone [Chitinophagaceae bacterium]